MVSLLATFGFQPLAALAQLETAFTYQGQLSDANGAADGLHDFVFSLFDDAGAQVGPSLTNLAVAVTAGRFTSMLDFGPDSFRRVLVPPRSFVGPGEWLEISVRTNKGKTYQKLSPRQRLTPAPYASAITGSLPSSALEGNYNQKVSFNNASNVFLGRYFGDAAGLTNLSAGALTSGSVPDARLSGNVALRSGGNTFTGNQFVSWGDVGIGTTSPESELDVRGTATLQQSGIANHDNLRIKKNGSPSAGNAQFVFSHRSDGTSLWLYGYNGSTYRNFQSWDHDEQTVQFPSGGQDLFINEKLGRVGIGTASPQQRLHVAGTTRMDGTGGGTTSPALLITNSSPSGIGLFSVTSSSDANMVVVNKAAGDLIKGFSGADGGNMVFQVNNAGQVYSAEEISCKSVFIRGGADLAEPFAMSSDSVPPGAVVVIDPSQPGRLKLGTEPYDSKVAGIVSGAGGVQPGISMIQTEALEGGRNVALSGRVYALVDADFAPVEPGDLLTTSSTPGHAMKAADAARRPGASIGKAMTPLKSGRGLVLVLVSLQ